MSQVQSSETKLRFSPGGIDRENGVVYEQIELRGKMMYARSDHGQFDPIKTNELIGYRDTYRDYMGTTYSALPSLPWKAPSEPLEYRDESYLFHSVRGFCEQRLVVRPAYSYAIAAWVLATYRLEEWRASGPLYALGPINSGKTTLLEVLEELAFRGIRVGSMSTATMFRLSDAYMPTFLIDESQIYGTDEWVETQALFNERYRPGSKVWRMVGEGRNMVPQAFNCYGATAMASSHAPRDALGSRALLVKMEKGRPEQHTGTPEFYAEAAVLRSQLLYYRLKILAFRLNNPLMREPLDPVSALLERVQDERTKEVGYPLIAVADPNCHSILVDYLMDLESQHQAIEETSDFASYVIALSQATIDNGKVSVVAVREELAKLWGLWDVVNTKISEPKQLPSSKWVSKVLQTLGFKPTRMPQTGRAGIVLDIPLFERLKLRYASQSDSLPSLARSQSESSDEKRGVPSQAVLDVPRKGVKAE